MRKLIALAAAVVSLCIPLGVQAGAPPTISLASTPAQVDQSVLTSATNGPVVATGTLLNASGRPIAGRVAVTAWVNDSVNRNLKVGDSVAAPTVGWANAGNDGLFTLRVDPSKVGADYLRPDGTVNLIAYGWTNKSQGNWAFTASVATPIGSASSGAATSNGSAASPVQFQLRAGNRLMTSQDVQAKASGAAIPAAIPPCQWILWSTYTSWARIGQTTPWGADLGWMHVGSTTETTTGVAFSTGGTIGTWKASGTSTFSSGVGIDFDHNTAYRAYEEQLNMGKWRYCGANSSSYLTQARYATGGFNYFGIPWANYSNCTIVPGGSTWSRSQSNGNHFKTSVGLDTSAYIGIDLSVDQNYDATHVLYYFISANEQICGDNAAPGIASNITTKP